jgi:hypothetical protein
VTDDNVNGKLDTVITELRENSEKLENIETLLIGDVKNTNKVGLIERIRKIETWIEKREWFEKVIIVAIVVNTIGLIFVLIQNLIY